MAEAFKTNIVLHGEDADTFIDTMVVSTPNEMVISHEELTELKNIAKKLGFGSL